MFEVISHILQSVEGGSSTVQSTILLNKALGVTLFLATLPSTISLSTVLSLFFTLFPTLSTTVLNDVLPARLSLEILVPTVFLFKVFSTLVPPR